MITKQKYSPSTLRRKIPTSSASNVASTATTANQESAQYPWPTHLKEIQKVSPTSNYLMQSSSNRPEIWSYVHISVTLRTCYVETWLKNPNNNLRHLKCNTIVGLEVVYLCIKTLRHAPDPIVSDYIDIPHYILYQNRKLYITAGLMFVNKIPFLVTLGQRVKFTAVENLPNYRAPTLMKGMRSVISLYNKQNWSISTVFMDNKFKVLEDDL